MEFQFLADHRSTTFFFLSVAENPGSTSSSTWKNADRSLCAGLQSAGLKTFRVIAIGDDDTQAQPGWAVVACEELVMALAARFKVPRVTHFTPEAVTEIDCATLARSTLSADQVRLIDPRRVKHFVLFVGSRASQSHDECSADRLREIVRKRFVGFTLSTAEGWFEGGPEGTICVHLGSDDYVGVLATAEELRIAFQQVGIGVSCNGIYQRVRQYSDFDFLLEGFGLR